MSKQDLVHRATEPASAPIGQGSPDDDSPAHIWNYVKKLEHDNEAAAKRIRKIEADLLECLEYFKDRYDIVDGNYGENAPNPEMVLGMMICETLKGRPW